MTKIESPAKGSPALLRKQIQSTGRQASHPHREAEKMNIQFRVVSCEITLFCSLLERFDDGTVVQHAPKLGKPCLSSLLARRPGHGKLVMIFQLDVRQDGLTSGCGIPASSGCRQPRATSESQKIWETSASMPRVAEETKMEK
jgi:hypothetical protein